MSVGSQIVEPIANELAQKVLVDHTASFIKDVKEYAGSNPPFVREQFSLLTKQLLKTLVKYDISEESGSKISAITPPNLAENPLEAHEVHLDPGMFATVKYGANGYSKDNFASRYQDLD